MTVSIEGTGEGSWGMFGAYSPGGACVDMLDVSVWVLATFLTVILMAVKARDFEG